MISVIVLAAGLSRRMGMPKMVLPWGNTTVLQRVVKALGTPIKDSFEYEMIVITGGWRQAVEKEVAILSKVYTVRTVFNPHFEDSGMAFSLRVGLAAAEPRAQAALIGLGDQPQVQERTVTAILQAYQNIQSGLIVPSFQGRRGHPWLVTRSFWADILNMHEGETLRDFLNAHARDICHVEADESILLDIDTLDEYRRQKPL